MEVAPANPEIKKEPGEYPAVTPIKIEQVYVSESSEILSANSFSHIKQEPQDVEEMFEEDLIDNISDLRVEVSELDRVIKNEIDQSFSIKIKPKTEINIQCDLPNLKSECVQSRKLLIKSKKKNIAREAKKNTYKCPVCQKSCISSESRTKHVTSHFAKKFVICRFCGQFFTNELQFLMHYFNYFVKKSKNKYSKYSEKRYQKLQIKEPEIYLKKPFKCEICANRFSRISHLIDHSRIHTGEKPFKCEICDKRFSVKGSVKKHNKVHTGEKPFKCKVCLKPFARSSCLTVHFRIHTGEKPYPCEICLKRFTLKGSLNKHYKVHTGEKPFKCEICAKQFNQSSNLNKHFNTHAGEKLFKCDVCLKEFALKCSLNRHYKIHTGEKPFKCAVCDREFNEKSKLIKHFRTHTGEKPYKCDFCSKLFASKSNLIRHTKALHSLQTS